MTTATARKPRKAKARTLTYNAAVGALFMDVDGKESGAFWVDRLDAGEPSAVAVRLTKFVAFRRPDDPPSYDVLARADGTGSCECLGHLRHGHKTVCRHVAAVAALAAAGRLS